MARPRIPFNNAPAPVPPNPVEYAANPDGYKEARRAYKKEYDAWKQRRRRAIERGEEVAALAPPLPLEPMTTAMVQAEASGAFMPPPSLVVIPVTMLPASMQSLLASRAQ